MIGANMPVGLYSIGIRDLSMPDLLIWAARVGVPFLHLRGGIRGVAILERTHHELEHWRDTAKATCPVTLVTCDATLAELTCDDGRKRSAAQQLLARTCASAAVLGARWVRILANTPAESTEHRIQLPDLEIGLLIELHHPSWWTIAGLRAATTVACRNPRVRILADSAQAAEGLALYATHAARRLADRAIALCDVVHLSDDGTGLGAQGHAILSEAVHDADRDIEIGFEWTGQPRTTEACLRRYRTATAWWNGVEVSRRKGEGS